MQKRHREKNRIECINYLLEHPCVDCGESNPLVLEFDHINPAEKSYDVGRALSGSHRAWKTILIEIEKCEVRCANCHRIRTAMQNGDDWFLNQALARIA